MSLSEQERKDIQEAYIKALQPGQFNDTAFLKSEVKRLMKSEPVIVERLFARLNLLNRKNPKELEEIKSLALRWELENTAPTELAKSNKQATQTKAKKETAPEAGIFRFDAVKRVRDFVQARAFFCFVLVPVFIFAVYLTVFASPRYVSQSQLLVQQNNQTPSLLDPSLAMFAGLSSGGQTNDPELVKAYIYSADMLKYLESELEFVNHYSDTQYDFFSRLESDATLETRLEYLANHVNVSIDPASSILTVDVQAFTADFAKHLNQVITGRAEWFINEIGQNLAKAKLAFIESDHARIEKRLQEAQSRLLTFQREYNLLDPEAEGLALQQITFALESQIATKTAELNALKSSMSDQAPMVIKTQEELQSLRRQLRAERNRLTNASENTVIVDNNEIGVNDILAKFSDYKIDLEFALQSYAGSKVSLESSRLDAYQQLKYLVLIESPTLPEDAKYPRIIYNLGLLFVCLTIVFGIAKLIIATADELK